MNFKNICVCGVFAVFLQIFCFQQEVESTAIIRATFNESCNNLVKCDRKGWLTCTDNGTCTCPDTMIWNIASSKCVAKSGERCRYQIRTQISDGDGNILPALYENVDCVPNANCHATDNICVCNETYYETTEGICQTQKDFGSNCTSSQECLSLKNLFCIDEKCICSNSINNIYSEITVNVNGKSTTTNTCVGKAGHTLRLAKFCVNHAEPDLHGYCTCKPTEEYYAGEDGLCHKRKSRGQECKKDDECIWKDHYFVCVNGTTCGCNPDSTTYRSWTEESVEVVDLKEVNVYKKSYQDPNPLDPDLYYTYRRFKRVRGRWLRNDRYSSEEGYVMETKEVKKVQSFTQCVGLAETGCNESKKCVAKATCTAKASSSEKVCKCNDGLAPTSTGLCAIGYGQPCSISNECSDSFVCTSTNITQVSTCQCPKPNTQKYISTKFKCVGLASSLCSTDSDCLNNSKCITNSTMNKNGRCICKTGYVENIDGECDIAYGFFCNYKSSLELIENTKEECDKSSGLICRNNRCLCPDSGDYFNDKSGLCLKRVGTRCNVSNKKINDCVPNAICSPKRPGGYDYVGRCKCNTGFVTSEDELCIPANITSTVQVSSSSLMESSVCENCTNVSSEIMEALDSDAPKKQIDADGIDNSIY